MMLLAAGEGLRGSRETPMASGEKGGGRDAAGLPSGVAAGAAPGGGDEGGVEVPSRCPRPLSPGGLFFCVSSVRVMRNGSLDTWLMKLSCTVHPPCAAARFNCDAAPVTPRAPSTGSSLMSVRMSPTRICAPLSAGEPGITAETTMGGLAPGTQLALPSDSPNKHSAEIGGPPTCDGLDGEGQSRGSWATAAACCWSVHPGTCATAAATHVATTLLPDRSASG